VTGRLAAVWRRFRYPDGFHTWRWRAVAVWLVAFTVLVAYSLQVQRDESRRNDRQQQAANVAQQRQINNDRHVLTELCRANSTELGIVSALILYVQSDPHPQSYRVRSTLAILAGQGVKLGQQTACEDVSHP
jgi:heme exporter protein D